jgi:TolB-like protein
MRSRVTFIIVFCFFTASCPAQDRELKDLATSLTAQVKQRGKGPVAITSFVNGDTYCSTFSSYLVDRLNIYIVRGNSDFDVVTRERVEEVFKEINLALGKNYDATTFAKVGRQMGARSLIRGSYTIQPAAATISVAVQLLDVESGRIVGGDVAEIPYTGDIRALLNDAGCSPQDHPTSVSPSPTQDPKSAESMKTDHAQPPVSETKHIGQLEVKLSGCRTDPEGLVCSALVTNLGADRQYCLVSKADAMMSRVVDAQGTVSIPRDITLGEQRGTFQMWQCASLPSGVPVAASLHFMVWPGLSTRMPVEGEQLKLVEFGFDLTNYSSKSPTSMFAQFHDVPITR